MGRTVLIPSRLSTMAMQLTVNMRQGVMASWWGWMSSFEKKPHDQLKLIQTAMETIWHGHWHIHRCRIQRVCDWDERYMQLWKVCNWHVFTVRFGVVTTPENVIAFFAVVLYTAQNVMMVQWNTWQSVKDLRWTLYKQGQKLVKALIYFPLRTAAICQVQCSTLI